MSDMVLFEEGNVPAHIRALQGKVDNSDLSAGVSTGFPIISIKGKVWHVVQGGVRTLVADDNGDPRSSIEVVILKSNPAVSKLYYAGGYTEGDDARPTCFSHDGVAPDPGSLEVQATKCAICPRNQWGSRVTENGAKGKECSDSRRLAVAPSGDLSNPMLLRVPAASLKELVAYAEMLVKRATPYSAVVTKISFDHTVAHQKFVMKAIRWLTAEEVAQVAETMDGAVVTAIIGDGMTHAPAREEDDIAGAPPANLALVNPAKAATVDEVIEAIAPKTAAAPKPAAKKAEPKPAPVVDAKAAAAAALEAEIAALIAKRTAEPAPEPAVETEAEAAVTPKRDHSKLLSEATASLDDVLATLDD